MTSYEDAKHCPKCDLTGELTKVSSAGRGAPRGTQVHTLTCRNSRCSWCDTNWDIQVNPDGTIPEPRKHEKLFRDIPDRTDEVRRMLDQSLETQRKGSR